MNINVEYWGKAFGSGEQLKNPEANIRAGAEMLFRIRNYLPPGSPVPHVATLYNNINAQQVRSTARECRRSTRRNPG